MTTPTLGRLADAAKAHAWTPPGHLLEAIAEHTDQSHGQQMCLVVRNLDHVLVEVVRDALGMDPVVVKAGEGPWARHLAMLARAPFDLVVDLAGGAGAVKRFADEVFHVKVGGTLLIRPDDAMRTVVADLQQLRASGDLAPPATGQENRDMLERDRHALAASISLREIEGFVVAVNQVETLAKARDVDFNRFLEGRRDFGRVLEVRPGLEFQSGAAVRHSQTGVPPTLPTLIQAPSVSLREYAGVICRSRQVVHRENVLLPDTFRHNAKPRLRNQALIDWAPRFVRRPDVTPVPISGAYFHLDNQFRGHFGHALTEQISRLWGWKSALANHPDLQLLVFRREGGPPLAPWEYELLEAAGISRDRVYVADRPIEVERLLSCSPMFSMPEFVHPDIVATYDALGEALSLRASERTWPQRVFCSRRENRRGCHNGDEVEAVFLQAGFEIVYPEELSLADQVEQVRRASVVAGYAGSGMFQIALAGEPKHVILVSSETYRATNEFLISAVMGHRLDLVLCRPDVQPESPRFDLAAYHSNFTFDSEREGRFLTKVLSDAG